MNEHDSFDPSHDLPENQDGRDDASKLRRQETLTEEETRELIWLDQVHLGDAAKTFAASELGLEMIARAQEIVQDAALDMLQTDVADAPALRALQLRAKAGQMFLSFIEEITTEGKQAYAALEAKYNQPE